MLTLYEHTESPCCQKVRMFLAEKQLSFDSIFVDLLMGANLTEEFLALNPKAQVPVLVHTVGDEKIVVTESTVICEYLEESFPDKPLYPETPAQRALARSWLMMVDTGIHVPHTSSLTFTIVFRNQLIAAFDTAEKQAEYLATIKQPSNRESRAQMLKFGYQAPFFAEALSAFDELFQKMEAQLTKTKWLAGDEFSIADLTLGPYIKRLLMLDLEKLIAPYTKVQTWYEALTSRESWQSEIAGKGAEFVTMLETGSSGAWDQHVEPVWAAQN